MSVTPPRRVSDWGRAQMHRNPVLRRVWLIPVPGGARVCPNCLHWIAGGWDHTVAECVALQLEGK